MCLHSNYCSGDCKALHQGHRHRHNRDACWCSYIGADFYGQRESTAFANTFTRTKNYSVVPGSNSALNIRNGDCNVLSGGSCKLEDC